MTSKTEKFNSSNLKQVPDVKPGDMLKIHQKIKEGDKERIQIFEGVVIAKKHGKGISATITVRKVVDGVGVERVFPIHSPWISRIEVVKNAKVRRSKLYYLRTAKGKKSRLKNKEFAAAISEPEEVPVIETLVEVSETPEIQAIPEPETK